MGTDRVLLVSYQCGPGMGSVSQLGWEWYTRLSGERPVTLVTHIRNRAALEAMPLDEMEALWRRAKRDEGRER